MCLSYIGGKSRIAPQLIVPNIPLDIETYVEGFGGMYWTFFSMDMSKYPRLNRVVYNDFNPLNYNLFQCITNPTELLKAVEEIPCQQVGVSDTPLQYKEQFYQFQQELFDPKFVCSPQNFEVAAKYAYILTSVFSGSKPESSGYIDLKGKYKSKFLTFRDKLRSSKWIEKFLRITDVEMLDFEDVIEKYDDKSTYIYLDPPYYKTENYYSNHDFGEKDHERLSNVLQTIKGRFSLSYYDFEKLGQWYPEDRFTWIKMEFAKAAAAKKGKLQTMGEELLILNY